MTMQMLRAAGMGVYTDESRPSDEDNPRGYFEHARAARLREDASWMPEVRGKAVKIVAHLLPYLPPGEQYRIVYMHRKLEEVVASQRVMLTRFGRGGAGVGDDVLARLYAEQSTRIGRWLDRAPGVRVLPLDYADALADPKEAAARLADFLGEPFDRACAAAAIDPALRRRRA